MRVDVACSWCEERRWEVGGGIEVKPRERSGLGDCGGGLVESREFWWVVGRVCVGSESLFWGEMERVCVGVGISGGR